MLITSCGHYQKEKRDAGRLINPKKGLNVRYANHSVSSVRLHLYAGGDLEEFHFYNISQVIQMQHI